MPLSQSAYDAGRHQRELPAVFSDEIVEEFFNLSGDVRRALSHMGALVETLNSDNQYLRQQLEAGRLEENPEEDLFRGTVK